ncbi:MAG: OmpA family protein [Bacteroidetes bacterium]|nr:MAG: OmpA family protein [Bacteroidota bacterium]
MPRFKKCYVLLLIWLAYCCGQASFAQIIDRNNKDKWKEPVPDKVDPRPLYFKNINRIAYFYDKERVERIKKLTRKDGSLMELYDALHKYVMNFGVKNFRKDWKLIAKLAEYAERLGYKQKADQLYWLVILHNRAGARWVDPKIFPQLAERDSSINKELAEYLPVELYHNYANPSANVDTLDVPESIYTNMGDSINSRYGDYGPALTANDLYMVFTSERNQKWDGPKLLQNEDLFISRKADSAYVTTSDQGSKIDTIPWTRAKPLKGRVNTEWNEGSPRISKDGKTIYFARCGAPDGYGNCDLYVSKKQPDGTWGKAHNLGIYVNTQSWESHPTLSQTEDTLFFASDRFGGFGMSDIYFCRKVGTYLTTTKDTIVRWSRAQNMGPFINTKNSEVSPFYHPIYPILYFSSNGHPVNFGGFDIYKTIKRDGIWLEPRNIGPLVNYKKDEYYFTIDSKARNLYYAKTIKVTRRDYRAVGDTVSYEVLSLHSAALPMEAQPEAIVKFEGIVKDSITGKAFEGIVSIVDLDEGIEVAPKYLKPDGSYRFDLIRDHNYLVIITGEDFFRVERQFLLKGDTSLNIITPSIKFKKWKFEAIEFAEGSSEITDVMMPDLDKLVIFLADHPNLNLKISGHTNTSGSAEKNKLLSQARANAIKAYLVDKGKFAPDRIEAIGYGSEKPIIPKEENDDHRHMNRRVEFEIIKQ